MIYVNTKRKAVTAIAALFAPKVKDTIEYIKKYIESMFENCEE